MRVELWCKGEKSNAPKDNLRCKAVVKNTDERFFSYLRIVLDRKAAKRIGRMKRRVTDMAIGNRPASTKCREHGMVITCIKMQAECHISQIDLSY